MVEYDFDDPQIACLKVGEIGHDLKPELNWRPKSATLRHYPRKLGECRMNSMTGAQLTVAIFFWGSAVVVGLDALKAAGWRRTALWSLTTAFVLCGFLVKPFWDVFPDLSAALGRLVSSPVTWLVLAAFTYLALRSPTRANADMVFTADDLRNLVGHGLARATLGISGSEPDPQESAPRRIQLSTAERERMTDRLIKLDDYLTGDFAREIEPFVDLLDWSEYLRLHGGAALHEKIEAPRFGFAERTKRVGKVLRAFDDETAVLNLHPLYLKTRMLPLEAALSDMSAVSEIMDAESINNAPLRLPGRLFSQYVTELTEEVSRVRSEIASWRKRIAQGEIG